MKLALAATLALASLVPARSAHALASCMGAEGWSPANRDPLPPHAHLVYWTDRRRGVPSLLAATINGEVVATKVTTLVSAPYSFLLVEIDSGATGTLALTWSHSGPTGGSTARFTVGAPAKAPTRAHGETTRYYAERRHTSVREVFDGLAITVDTPASYAHVRLRRDAQAVWTELDVPVMDRTIRIGELGCQSNYTPQLLEAGVDLEITLVLADGTRIPVADLSHAAIPKRAPSTDTWIMQDLKRF